MSGKKDLLIRKTTLESLRTALMSGASLLCFISLFGCLFNKLLSTLIIIDYTICAQ